MQPAEVFKALGDPTRLEMVKRLSGGSSHTIQSVSANLGITRQGARKHLDTLAQAKLVTLQPKGRDVAVVLNLATFEDAKTFITRLEKRWDQRLGKLKDFLEK